MNFYKNKKTPLCSENFVKMFLSLKFVADNSVVIVLCNKQFHETASNHDACKAAAKLLV